MSSISNRNMMSGLISGLDTEQLVKAMTMNTKNRINSQKQKLQTLQWKQESYRDVISKITDFKEKYLRIDAESSIKANRVMKKYVAESSNDKVITASASSNAVNAKYTIKQAHAAKAASISSKGSVGTGEVRLDFSDAVQGKSYDVKISLDGIEKTVTFTGGASVEDTKKNFLAATNATFAEIKGKDKQFEFTNGTSDLKFNSGDDIFHTFSVGYNSEAVGLANTAYNRINTSSSISSVGFKQALKETDDGKYAFNINGVDFEFDKDATISSVINTVNDSKAGVKLSFSNVSQSFTVETTNTGDAAEINIYQKKGNLLNSMFNLEEGKLGSTAADTAKLTYEVNGSASAELGEPVVNDLKDGKGIFEFTFTDNLGNKKNVKVDMDKVIDKTAAKDDNGKFTDEAVQAGFRKAVSEALGSDAKSYSISYAGGKITMTSADYAIELKGEGVTKSGQNVTNLEERNADPAYVPFKGVNEMTFNVNGEDVKVEASSADGISMQDLIDKGIINMPTNGNIIAAGDIKGSDMNAEAFLVTVFGKKSVTGANADDIMTARGANSMIEVSSDGETFTKYSSATNLFTFDGTTINLTEAKDFVAASEDEYITVDTKKDNSAIKDVVVKFVDDYNKLIEDLYKVTSTSRPKSSGSYYDPLTEEQEEEMSDKEIERWNENAKQGLLYRDNNIQKFLSNIRSAMLTRVDGFGLADLGISTKNWQDNGKLEIDESKLDTAIEAYGDKVANLFTGTDGLAAKLEGVVDKAVSTSKTTTQNYGYLSQLAGIEGTKTDKDNSIYKQMEAINRTLERLNTKYENEQERYWKQYTRLEKLMAQMQSTMSYFEQ